MILTEIKLLLFIIKEQRNRERKYIFNILQNKDLLKETKDYIETNNVSQSICSILSNKYFKKDNHRNNRQGI